MEYARRWAYSRNPEFYDFNNLGGDCTNFASQCILAGAGTMNYSPIDGWYYITANDRSASWTGVEFLYNFLVNNKGSGPRAAEMELAAAEPGDIIQLADGKGDYYHTLVVLTGQPEILVAAHTQDALYRPLDTYSFSFARMVHIINAGVEV